MLTLENEADLIALRQNEAEEGLTLEFKRDLNIASREDKEEAAKDVSALANSVGGQIVYGIEEIERPNGSKVAGALFPLIDGTLAERLRDVLHSLIQPRPRFNSRQINVAGGYVIVVDVFPSLGNDLHMVAGYRNFRFHRRNDSGTYIMPEPEVREAYVRIAVARQALESQLEHMVASEFQYRPGNCESVFVVPLFGHRELINPRQFGPTFGYTIAAACDVSEWVHGLQNLRVCYDGYRFQRPAHDHYVSVLREGVVHLCRSWPPAVRRDDRLSLYPRLVNLVAALQVAGKVLDLCSHWGPVRIVHMLTLGYPTFLFDDAKSAEQLLSKPPVPAGTYQHFIHEVNLRELRGDYVEVIRSLMDQVFQTNGTARCGWFSESGDFAPLKGHFAPEIRKFMRVPLDAT
jgi:hypothetical protein